MLAKWNGKLIAVSFLLNLTPFRIAAHKKRPALQQDQIHVEKWIPPLRGLFSKSPAECHAC